MSRWILKMSSCGSNANIETSAPLINDIVNNALFHSNSRINQILPQIINILRFFWWTRCPILWNKCIDVRAVQWTEIWKFIQVFYIVGFLSLAIRDASSSTTGKPISIYRQSSSALSTKVFRVVFHDVAELRNKTRYLIENSATHSSLNGADI